MVNRRRMARLAYGALAGVVSGAFFAEACAGSAPAASEAPPASSTVASDGFRGGEVATASTEGPAVAASSAPPKCPYGELSDPHRGFVRCLTPDERDAGWLPPTAQTPPVPTPSPSAEPDAGSPQASGPAPLVEIGSPAFENGQVPRTEKALVRIADAIGKCVGDHGGLQGATGSMKVTFLVRVRGRAEGVEVANPKNVSSEAKDCVRLLLKNRPIGAPSADPVGVTVSLTFRPR
jgi:hypothetical protein